MGGYWGRCSQQKTCNITETGQDMTKIRHTIDDQYEVAYIRAFHYQNQCPLQLRGLDDLEQPFRTLFQNTCVFGTKLPTTKI